MKTCGGGGVGGTAPSFLNSALYAGERSASSPGRFNPGERTTMTRLDRRLGGPQCQSGPRGEEKNNLPLLEIELRPSPSLLYKWMAANFYNVTES
jgi:hypothetical protein